MNRVAALAFILLLGCSSESNGGSLDSLELVEGAPCHWHEAMCVDEIEMLHCQDGQWVQQACTDYCGSLGPGIAAGGCNTDEHMQSPDLLCGCVPPEQGCHPGESRCNTDDVLGWCGDDWTWRSSSCSDLCEDRQLLSRGCGNYDGRMTCLCTNVGLPCEGEESVCIDESTLARCESGIWVERGCDELCEWAAPCEPGHPGGAACGCKS